MSRSPLQASPDLRRLVADGFSLEIVGGLLLVRDVPFVAMRGVASMGTLVVPLSMAGDRTVAPKGHAALFIGGTPFNEEGRPLDGMVTGGLNPISSELGEGVSLCMRPATGKYRNYHELVTSYVAVISTPARQTGRQQSIARRPLMQDAASPFIYADTATARAGIGAATDTLAGARVGIVGLGGTGSYVLDLIAKTPVREIRIIDGDRMLQHNAFRAPGAASLAELRRQPYKVEHLAATYSRMHKGIVAHAAMIGDHNLELLDDLDFVFLSLDAGKARGLVAAHLSAKGVAFVDAGMGLERTEHGLVGSIRVTTATSGSDDAAAWRLPVEEARDDDPYASNIQVADLNALAASMAVIRWKRLRGFYADTECEALSVFAVDGNHISNDGQRPATTPAVGGPGAP